MKTTIKLKDLKKILDDMPKKKVEYECKSWGCVTPHYTEMVEPCDVLWYVNEYLKNGR